MNSRSKDVGNISEFYLNHSTPGANGSNEYEDFTSMAASSFDNEDLELSEAELMELISRLETCADLNIMCTGLSSHWTYFNIYDYSTISQR